VVVLKALIISNGDLKDIDILKYYNNVDVVICADGGARHLYNRNLKPDIIIGDLDSLDGRILESYKNLAVKFEKHPTRKNMTDTELSINYAINIGAREIVLLGATGNRLDHSIANVLILYRLAYENVNMTIIDSHNEIFVVKNILKLRKKEGYFISIIPLVDSKVTLKGFEYNTNSLEFKLGSTLGISNRIIDEEGLIQVDSGICLVIRSRE